MKYLTKTFAFGDFWNKFCGKNFRKFKIRFIFVWKNFWERPKSK